MQPDENIPTDDPLGPLAAAVAGEGERKPARRIPGLNLAKAVIGGIGDTAKDMLQAGREEAQRAHNEAWTHYDDLTKRRRELKERDEDRD